MMSPLFIVACAPTTYCLLPRLPSLYSMAMVTCTFYHCHLLHHGRHESIRTSAYFPPAACGTPATNSTSPALILHSCRIVI